MEPTEWKVATDDLIVEETEEGVKEKPKVLTMVVGNSQRRSMAMKIGLVQAQVATTLQEMRFAKAELKHLNMQIQQLNQVLKVISSTMFIRGLQLLQTNKQMLND